MPTNPTSYHDAVKLREAGVHLAPYGLPEYPKAGDVGKLRRQIAKGIPMPSGDVASHDSEMIAALADGWLRPDQMVAQFSAPRYKSSRAGMVATVSGLMAATSLQTNPFNPRPNTKLAIPDPDSNGRVAMPWAPTDRKVDPENVSRMLFQVPDRSELNRRILESERLVVSEQSSLAGLIAREAIEEDALAIIVNFGTGGLPRRLAPTTIDGNSRLAISRAEARTWIATRRNSILDTVKAPKAKAALNRTMDLMRDGLFPLEQTDALALRHLHQAMVSMVETESTDELIAQRLYAVPNLFVVPVTMIVAFEPAGPGASVLDAADQMMRNVHHPSRAPKVWDQTAGHSEIRDEVVGKLHDEGHLTLGEALYVGPKYEEASRLHGLSSDPDTRAYAAISLINGQNGIGRIARGYIAEAIGAPKPSRGLKAQMVTSILSEQVRTLDTPLRKSFESTMNDVLDSADFGATKRTPDDSGQAPETLLELAEVDIDQGLSYDNSAALQELALKGAVALAALGHLVRSYGTTTAEAARPYQVIRRMIDSQLGRELLADAISAWRDDEVLVEFDLKTRQPIEGSGAMRPSTLAALFSPDDGQSSPDETAVDKLNRLHRVLADHFQPLLQEISKLPEVRREGISQDSADALVDILGPARAKIELLALRNEEFLFDDEDAATTAQTL